MHTGFYKEIGGFKIYSSIKQYFFTQIVINKIEPNDMHIHLCKKKILIVPLQ